MLFLFIHIISVFNLDTDLKIITYLKLLLLLFYLFIPLSLIAQKTNESVSFDTKKQVSQFLIENTLRGVLLRFWDDRCSEHRKAREWKLKFYLIENEDRLLPYIFAFTMKLL